MRKYRLALQLRDWNSYSIKPTSWHENRHDCSSGSSWTNVRRLRLELLLKFHSYAASAARSGWRLFQGLRRQWLHVRRWRPATAEWTTVVDRPLRSTRPDHSRRDDLQHLDVSHLDGSQRSFSDGDHRDRARAVFGLVLSRSLRGDLAPLIPIMAAQTSNNTPDIVVRGDARSFKQEITAGKHRLTADEPVSAGGGDAGPDPYDYLLISLGVCTSMTVGLYARRKEFRLETVTVSLRHSRIYARDCEECETKDGMLDRIDVEVELTGPLSAEQHGKLMEIAAKCPVHRTLTSEINIRLRPGQKSNG